VLIDARSLPENERLEADICIVGAGPAGITLARELLSTGARICILESGDLMPGGPASRLRGGESVGYPYARLDNVNERAVGGTSHRWRGWHACPLDRIDFEARGAVSPGWPFERAALVPYYRRAEEICGADPFDYADSPGRDEPLSAHLPVADGSVVIRSLQVLDSPFRAQAEQLIRAPSAKLVVNAFVSELEAEETGSRIARLRALSAPRRGFTVDAPTYVLAAGGIETPRLLLLSRGTHPHGLGNTHDQVGRYFTEHLAARSGVIVPTGPQVLAAEDLYMRPDPHAGANRGRAVHRPVLALGENVLREHELLNVAFLLEAQPRALACNGTRSLATLARAVLSHPRPRPPALARHTAAVARDAGSVAVTVARRLARRQAAPDVLVMRVQSEQQPNRDSRVSLGRKRDALGLPLPRLDWRISPLDDTSIRRAQDVVDEQLRAAGLGTVDDKLGSERPPVIYYGLFHHLGTTRMHASPKQGVVDADCRVHGVSNLFVAGSSVFPTAGWANPTLTIVALAVRLANHLKQAHYS
jgi:choline dehydrogenase-like flavoprotein